jgi:hypothetical protein
LQSARRHMGCRDDHGRRAYAGYRMDLAVIRFLSVKLITDQIPAAM